MPVDDGTSRGVERNQRALVKGREDQIARDRRRAERKLGHLGVPLDFAGREAEGFDLTGFRAGRDRFDFWRR